jgi:hypothetical protein
MLGRIRAEDCLSFDIEENKSTVEWGCPEWYGGTCCTDYVIGF